MSNELRYALRRLNASLGFSVFAVVTLALGIGATMAYYSVIHAILLRPIDIRDLDRVVNVYHASPRNGGRGDSIRMSWPDVEALRRRQTAFAEILAWTYVTYPINRGDLFQMTLGELVEGHYFDFVGSRPALGRPLQAQDDSPGAPAVVVISDSLWRTRFGAAPTVLGQTIQFGEIAAEVVGVMPTEYRGIAMPNVIPTQFWLPIRFVDDLSVTDSMGDRWTDFEARWLMLKARLRPGIGLDEARAELQVIAGALDASTPIGRREDRARRSPAGVRDWFVILARDVHAHESIDDFAMPVATAALAAVTLVLLVTCTNVANMLLARGEQRTHEIAVRRVVGASRPRLIAELMLDSVLLALAGGTLALPVGLWLMTLLSGPVTVSPGIVISVLPKVDWSVVGVGIVGVGMSILVFGLVPAWHTTRPQLRAILDQKTDTAVTRWRGRRILIAAQVSVSVALLSAGAVFVRHAWVKAGHDPGFELDSIAASQLDFSFGGYSPERAKASLVRAVDELRADSVVQSAAIASRLPIYFNDGVGGYVGAAPSTVASVQDAIAYHRAGRIARVIVGTAGLIESLGLRIEVGRPFTESEAATHANLVLISRSLAERVFGGVYVVGRTMYLATEPREIIGVYDDVDVDQLGSRRAPTLIQPGIPNLDRSVVVVVRARQDPVLASHRLRAALLRADPTLPVLGTRTGASIREEEMFVERVGSRIIESLGGFALLLALVGLSGLLMYFVRNRRREVGLRMALGASRHNVVRFVLWEGMRPVLYGLIPGLIGGAWLSMFVGASFYGNKLFDLTGLVVVPVFLIPVAVGVCYVPARRAGGVDPNVALRDL